MSRLDRLKLIGARGLARENAALYVGVSPSKFDEMVGDGRMPQPKRVDGRVIWDRIRLDAAFDALPDRAEKPKANSWDDLHGEGAVEGR